MICVFQRREKQKTSGREFDIIKFMRRKRRKRSNNTVFSILSGIFLILAATGVWGAAERPWADVPAKEEAAMQEPLAGSASEGAFAQSLPSEASELTVHFLDVGQGDCTLIVCDGEAMLIDAGNNDKGTTVQLYLTKQGVESLKYVIGTHPDADHIGGLDVILYKLDCETVIMPDKSSETATYRDVLDAMESKGLRNTLPVVGDTYALGSATFTIVSPSKSYDDSNNCSVAVLLTHGENSFLFTGDAESEAENDMLETGLSLNADVYKAGHHGSSSSSTETFLETIKPEYAVISCGTENPYGHPHAETLNHLREMGVRVFRTDEQGTIIVTSDGSTLTWNCSPSETWQSG